MTTVFLIALAVIAAVCVAAVVDCILFLRSLRPSLPPRSLRQRGIV